MPIVIWRLISAAPDLGQGTAIISMVTLFVTIILGFQKTIGAWLNQRALLGSFWEARSKISTALYSFEDSWRDKDLSEQDERNSFFTQLNAASTTARAVVDDEQKLYFESFKIPLSAEVNLFDFGSIFSTAKTGADSLVASVVSKDKIKEIEERESSIREKEITANALLGRLSRVKEQLSGTRPKKERDALLGQIQKIQEEIDNIEADISSLASIS